MARLTCCNGGLVLAALFLTFTLHRVMVAATRSTMPLIVDIVHTTGNAIDILREAPIRRELTDGSNTSSEDSSGVQLEGEGGFLDAELVAIFGDEKQSAYEDFIKAVNMACYFEGAKVNASDIEPQFLASSMQFQNASVVEKFVRKNILPTRNTIVVAFATILSSLLAAVIPSLFVSIMLQAFLPNEEEQGAAKSRSEMKPAAEHGGGTMSKMAKCIASAINLVGGLALLAMSTPARGSNPRGVGVTGYPSPLPPLALLRSPVPSSSPGMRRRPRLRPPAPRLLLHPREVLRRVEDIPTHTYTHTHIHTYTHAYTCIHTYTHIRTHTCTHTCTGASSS